MGLVRVGAVSYLNTVPLVWGMLHGDQHGRFDLSFSVPSECADRLAGGAIDVGILPAIEVARQRLKVLPGMGIVSHGAVRSILLISKVPFDAIRSLAADSGSRTSVELVRIILARRWGVRPAARSMTPDLGAMLEAADAALLIGDNALRAWASNPPYRILDLGEAWTEMTGLPMVFAVWAGRPQVVTEELVQAFADSCRFGLANLEAIVSQESPARGLGPELVRTYLTQNISYAVGEAESAGMRLFLEYAGAAG